MKLQWFVLGVCLVLCGVLCHDEKATAQTMQEYSAYVTDAEFQGVIEESMSNIISTRGTIKAINWTVPSNRRYTTVYFGVSAGHYITIALRLSKSAKAGIIDADGYVRYVQGTQLDHAFKITKTNSYLVFVQNLNSTSITAKGSYAYN